MDAFSSWEDFLIYILVALAIYGGLWILIKIFGKDKQESEYHSPTKSNDRESTDNNRDNDSVGSPIITRVAGVTFENRQNTIHHLNIGDALELRQEPDNPYDSKAIMVLTLSNELIGYIPSDIVLNVQWFFELSEIPPFTIVKKIVEVEHETHILGVVIEISPPSKDEIWLTTFHKYPPF